MIARHRLTALTLLPLFALSVAPRAEAYNYDTHRRLVEIAVDIMSHPPSASIGYTEHEQFVAAMKAAPDKLSYLLADIGTGAARTDNRPYPFADEGANACQVFQGDASNGGRADDLSKLDAFRIREFRYWPDRGAKPCGLTLVDDAFRDSKEFKHPKEESPSAILGYVLGWHAGMIDDCVDDSVLWVRPTNAATLGEITAAMSYMWELGAGLILLPFACLYEAIWGDGCDWKDGGDAARSVNPVEWITGMIPGAGNIKGTDYTGLWHFIHMESITKGDYNDNPGMHYLWAGEDFPGLLDWGIFVGAAASGLSLNAEASDGDDHYGQYDRTWRAWPSWQAMHIGHLEFSSLDNLAQYGWDTYRQSGYAGALGLGHVLHALGDAGEPHHVTGTTSHGHRPYEDFVQQHSEELMGRPYATPNESTEFEVHAANVAYSYWKSFKDGHDVRALVTQLAKSTSAEWGEWADEDIASYNYWDAEGEPDEAADKQAAIDVYLGEEAKMRDRLAYSVGAIIAFLTEAAGLAARNGERDLSCDPWLRFSVETRRCESKCGGARVCTEDSHCAPEGSGSWCSDYCCTAPVPR